MQRRCQGGAVLVELALALMILMPLAAGVAGYSRMVSQAGALHAAAHAGARAAARYDWRSPGTVDWRSELYTQEKGKRLAAVGKCAAAHYLERAGYDHRTFNIQVSFRYVAGAGTAAPAVRVIISPTASAVYSFFGSFFASADADVYMMWEPAWDSSVELPALPSAGTITCAGV